MTSIFKKILKKPASCAAIIVAAGSATRMNGVDKVMAVLDGHPVIYHTIKAFQDCDLVDDIVVVTREDLLNPIGEMIRESGFDKVKQLALGGADRVESVMNGLEAITTHPELIAIHDAARPFVSQDILSDTISTARKSAAAAPAVPVNDTIKTAENSIVTGTPDRSKLFAIQTPQVFDADLIRGALYYCKKKCLAITDDCSAVEILGKKVVLTVGSPKNIKITTPFDLVIGEAILSCQNAD